MTTHLPRLPIGLDPLVAEAKRRMRHRRRVLTLVLVGVAALAVGLTLTMRPGTPQADSRAALRPFVGAWGGHGKGLTITPSGRGREVFNIPSPHPPFSASLTFQIISVTGTRVRAEARYRVTNARAWFRPPVAAPVAVGTIGILRLRRGVITDWLSGAFFCGPGSAPGACGA